MSSPQHVLRKAKSKKGNNNGNKILNYVQRGTSSSAPENVVSTNENLSVDECEFPRISENLVKPKIIDQSELQKSLDALSGSKDVNKMFSVLLNAYSTLANAVDSNFAACSKIAQSVDDNNEAFLKITDQLNDNVENLSRKHHEYVHSNENDKQQLKVKTDLRFYKSQMIIYLKNDDILKSDLDNCMPIAEKIIKDQGLSLGRAYITKAIILSGLKKINNINKCTKYLYIHFSDSFTSERLIMEMITKNRNGQKGSPDVFFSQPSSYDIRKLSSICHDLRSDGSVSKVFHGDDAIKVTLHKKDPLDPNEKVKKVHVRNFADLDKLRKDVGSKSCNISTRTFYNKEYWTHKKSHQGIKRRRKADEDKTDDETFIHSTSSSTKKQRKFTRNHDESNVNQPMDYNDSMNSSFNSAREDDK